MAALTCPRCQGGRLFADGNGEVSCANCGHVVYADIPLDLPLPSVGPPNKYDRREVAERKRLEGFSYAGRRRKRA